MNKQTYNPALSSLIFFNQLPDDTRKLLELTWRTYVTQLHDIAPVHIVQDWLWTFQKGLKDSGVLPKSNEFRFCRLFEDHVLLYN